MCVFAAEIVAARIHKYACVYGWKLIHNHILLNYPLK